MKSAYLRLFWLWYLLAAPMLVISVFAHGLIIEGSVWLCAAISMAVMYCREVREEIRRRTPT